MDDDALIQSDYDLALQIACGDEDALRQLIRDHGPRVRGFLKKRYPRVWEDAWQLTLLRIVNKIHYFDPDRGDLRTWILKLAQNCARSALRAERRHDGTEAHEGIECDERRPPEDPPSAKELRRIERRAQQIREAIESLPPKERRVIEADLAHWQGKTLPDEVAPAADLAERWGDTNANAVHQARSRARRKLREDLTRRGVYSEDHPA